MAVVQVNIRMDDALKQAGDEVLERYGFSAARAVRMLWEYAARTGEVPDFMWGSESDVDERVHRLSLIEGGRGAVVRAAREVGIACVLPGDTAAATRIAWGCVERMLDIAVASNGGHAECREALLLRDVHGGF